MTQDAIDGQRYRTDPRDHAPFQADKVEVRESPKMETPEVLKPEVREPQKPAPEAPEPVVLPNTRRTKDWLRQGEALKDDLKRQRLDCEAAVKVERKKITAIDKAIASLDATLAMYTPAANRWSFNHDRCISCGTVDSPHKALGRCTTCESQYRRDKKRGIA